MKVVFISDLHLGYAYGSELGEDSFANAAKAFELALEEKPDIILIGGDIFHDKVPRQEVLGKAIELFTTVNQKLKKVLLLKKVSKGQEESTKEIIPAVIGIWGTHERRHAQSTNPAQLLEKAGLIYLLHAESILVESGYEKLGVHGLSGVPEDYAREALSSWDPKPFENVWNALLLHQNLAELIPAQTNAIRLADLPAGFDLYLLGHFHWRYEDEHFKTNAPILIPGSLVVTQLNQKEATREKGFFVIDLPSKNKPKNIVFRTIETRPYHYILLQTKNERPIQIQNQIEQAINKVLPNSAQKPLIKVKVAGTLASGFNPADVVLTQVYKQFSEKAILNIDKSDLTASDTLAKTTLLRGLKEKQISVNQLGLELIRKNLSVDIEMQKLEQIFDSLAEEDLDKAESLIC